MRYACYVHPRSVFLVTLALNNTLLHLLWLVRVVIDVCTEAAVWFYVYQVLRKVILFLYSVSMK